MTFIYSIPNCIHFLADASIFTPTNLALYFGQYMVRVHVSQSGRFDGPERGGLWGLQDDTEVLVR